MTSVLSLKEVSKHCKRGKESVAVLARSLQSGDRRERLRRNHGPVGSGKTTLLNLIGGLMVTHDPKAAGCASHELHVDKGQLMDGSAMAVA
jgi:ABC-type lipoprotein export system ATPase subunit